MSLYKQLVAAGAEINNHFSDLYVRWTPEAMKLVQDSKKSFSFFTNQVAGGTWIDVPFAYDPYWESKNDSA